MAPPERAVVQAQEAQAKATALVIGLLAQARGDVTFSQDTINRMNAEISRMGYRVVPTAEGLVRVVLVMQETEAELKAEAEKAAGRTPKEPDAQIILTD